MATDWRARIVSAAEAASVIKSGQRVFLTGNCSTPKVFAEALCKRCSELYAVEIVQLLDMGAGDFITADMAEHIRINSLFISGT